MTASTPAPAILAPATLLYLRERQPSTLCLADHERHVIACALLDTCGNVSQAAKLLGISRRTMHRAITRWPDLTPRRPQTKAEKQVRKIRRLVNDLPPDQREQVVRAVLRTPAQPEPPTSNTSTP